MTFLMIHLKDAVMNQCIRLVNNLVKLADLRPVFEVKRATVGLISTLGNIRSVILKSNLSLWCLDVNNKCQP